MKHKLEITIYGKDMDGEPTLSYEDAFDAVRREFLRIGVQEFALSAFTTVYYERELKPHTSYKATADEYGVGSGEMKGVENRLRALCPDDTVWCEWNEERV